MLQQQISNGVNVWMGARTWKASQPRHRAFAEEAARGARGGLLEGRAAGGSRSTDLDLEKPEWFYLDTHGTEQGPFNRTFTSD